MSDTTATVDTPTAAHAAAVAKLELVRALRGGTAAMRAKGKKYLPQEPAESDPNYERRLNRTTLFPGYDRTIRNLTGEVFSKKINLKDDVPDEIKDLCENIDLAGNDINRFAADVFEAGIDDGVSFILVDKQQAPRDENGEPVRKMLKKDAKKLNLRPYWVHIKAENIWGRVRNIGGEIVFSQICIRETTTEPDGDWGEKTVKRIRVLRPGSYQLYLKDGDTGEWGLEDEGKTGLDFIPLVPYFAGKRITPLTSEPPLEDLAYLNLEHWQSKSDQKNILHVVRVPLLFGKVLDKDESGKITVSANSLIHSDSEDADLKYVEHTGAGIDAGRQDLQDLENQMGIFGLQLLSPAQPGTVTATERSIDAAESDSTLKWWATRFGDALEVALEYTAKWMGKESGGSVDVNTDFKFALSSYGADLLVKACIAGKLPVDMLFQEFQRRGFISEEYDIQDFKQMLQNDGISSALPGLSAFGTNPDQQNQATG